MQNKTFLIVSTFRAQFGSVLIIQVLIHPYCQMLIIPSVMCEYDNCLSLIKCEIFLYYSLSEHNNCILCCNCTTDV